MKVNLHKNTNALQEIFQSNEIKFAFVFPDIDGDYSACHPLVKCRDFFNDILFVNNHPDTKESFNVYGLRYDIKKDPINLAEVQLIIKLPNNESYKLFKENFNLLNKVEEFLRLPLSSFEEVENHKDSLLIKGNKFWQKKTLLFNIYSLLLKLCGLDIKDKSFDSIFKKYNVDVNWGYANKELHYINTIGYDKFCKILSSLRSIEEFDSKYIDGFNALRSMDNIHNYSGILSMYENYFRDNQEPIFNLIQRITSKKEKVVFKLFDK